MSANMYTTLSLFSGGMGLDIGLDQTGRFHHLGCVELMPSFCQTIRTNRDAGRLADAKLRVYEGDISNYDPEKIMSDLGLKPGDLDLILGGRRAKPLAQRESGRPFRIAVGRCSGTFSGLSEPSSPKHSCSKMFAG